MLRTAFALQTILDLLLLLLRSAFIFVYAFGQLSCLPGIICVYKFTAILAVSESAGSPS